MKPFFKKEVNSVSIWFSFALILALFTTSDYVDSMSYKYIIVVFCAMLAHVLLPNRCVILFLALGVFPIHIHTLLNSYGIIESDLVGYSIKWPFPSVLNQKNLYGFLIVLSIISSFYLIKQKAKNVKRLVYVFMILLDLLMLYLIDSRMSQLGLAFVLILFFVLKAFPNREKKLFTILPLLTFFVPILLLWLKTINLFPDRVRSIYERLYFWEQTIQSILGQPINGYGFRHMAIFSKDLFSLENSTMKMNPLVTFEYCHNFFLQLVYDMGWLKVSLMGVLVVYLCFLKYRQSPSRFSEESKYWIVVLSSLLLIAQLTVAFNTKYLGFFLIVFVSLKFFNSVRIKIPIKFSYLPISLSILMIPISIMAIKNEKDYLEKVSILKKMTAQKDRGAIAYMSEIVNSYGDSRIELKKQYIHLLIDSKLYFEANTELKTVEKKWSSADWNNLRLKLFWSQKEYVRSIELIENWMPKIGFDARIFHLYLIALEKINECKKFEFVKNEIMSKAKNIYVMWSYPSSEAYVKTIMTKTRFMTPAIIKRNYLVGKAKTLDDVKVLEMISQERCSH